MAPNPMSKNGPTSISAALPLTRDPLPPPVQLQQPEEQTDNWDDDFEEGISLVKIQGLSCHFKSIWLSSGAALEKPVSDDEKTEEANARTIRPTKSPSSASTPLSKPPPTNMAAIVEDYSDLLGDDDELIGKVEDFKVLR